MTHRQAETSKEIRLWINQVIIPAGMVVGTMLSISPEAREWTKCKGKKFKEKIKTIINKW